MSKEIALPPAFAHRMTRLLGEEEFENLANILDGDALTSIRLNPYRKAAELEHATPVAWCPWGYYLDQRPVFTLDPLFHAGQYYVQEAASMFLFQVLDQLVEPMPGLKVLDLCAAPGGKSTLLASWMRDQGLLVSNEVIPDRASVLMENIIRFGWERTVVTQNDPSDFEKLGPFFDVVVVDAPCSGEGLFRKDKNARDLWSEGNVEHCSSRQKRIIAHAVSVLKPGGTLIYSTCTFATAENEENSQWMAEHFDLDPLEVKVESNWGVTQTKGPEDMVSNHRFYPHRSKGEGFFLAALRKKGNPEPTKSKQKKKKKGRAAFDKNTVATFNSWLSQPEQMDYIPHKDGSVVAVPADEKTNVLLLLEQLKVKYAGINMGKWTGRELVPAHSLAMSRLIHPNQTTLPVSKEEALKYLSKQEMKLPNSGGKGWRLVTYQNNPLGWVKLLPNRINNYLPTNWRIRMEIPKGNH